MSLKRSHPAPVFVHLALVMILTMLVKNRAVLALSLAAGLLTQTLHEKSKQKPCSGICFFRADNHPQPAFQSERLTTLYIGRLRITEEALLAGLDIALMILAVIQWFILFNHCFPQTNSSTFSERAAEHRPACFDGIAIRFPSSQSRGRIGQAQRLWACMGRFFNRVKSRMKTFVALISWSLENALDAALAMRARGFGSAKERITDPIASGERSRVLIVSISAFIICHLSALRGFGGGLFFFGGAILEMKEKLKWHWLRSKSKFSLR